MKKSSCISLTLALLLLTACTAKEAAPAPVPAPEISAAETTVSGEDTPSAAEPEPEPTSEPAPVPAPEPIPEPVPEPTPELEPMSEPSGDRLEKALACVDQDISALYAAIGEPESSRYEYSCSGPGDDGVLFYDGFLVFTYKENGVETVVDAEAES